MTSPIYKKILGFLASRKFFYLLVIFFVIEAVWIAISGVYPMAYDESYHLGIIQLYSHQLSPFFAHQPANSALYGELTQDPSYMYHWLMSFPYRLIEVFTKDLTIQVVVMRFIDIAFFTSSLVLFRKVLLKFKASKGLINLALLFFVLIPNVSLLAAQINYDDMLMPLVAISLLLTLACVERLRANKATLAYGIGWLSLGFLTSLVMYTFLPIFFAEGLYLFLIIVKAYRHNRGQLWQNLRQQWRGVSRLAKICLVLALILTGGLFVERDGYNTIAYGLPTPECNQVLSVAACSNYGPWERNYQTLQNKASYGPPSFIKFSWEWIKGNVYTMFFAINGSASDFYSQPPLPVPEWTAVILGSAGVLLIVIYRRKIFSGNDATKLGFVIILVYTAILFGQNLADYLHLGTEVAINARYLVPILPLFLVLLGMAYRELLRSRVPRVAIVKYKAFATVAVILLFINGSGAATFILRSNAGWYWPSPAINDLNQAGQKILRPVVMSSTRV